MVNLVQVVKEMLLKQSKNCLFMAGSQHFSPGDIQFQLIYDRGQCAESSYLKTARLHAVHNEEKILILTLTRADVGFELSYLAK